MAPAAKMSNYISIGSVRLPLNDFAVARTGVLGITRSGKTYAAKGIAEQLLAANVPIIVFDAIGVWRFLKTPAPGGKGFPLVIAGGAEPDLPLTPQSAPEIVRAAIRENIPLVIDLYDPRLSKADWRRIVQHCFRTLLYENKGVRHIFLEEASEYVPQRIIDGETFAEVEKLARMGGNVGLGITFINQRAQELAKSVLELCDNLILLRQRGSHAIGSLEKWLDRVSPDTAREISKSLPHMTQGECWVWAEDSESPVRTKTAAIQSFHPDRRVASASAPRQASVDTGAFVTRLSGVLGALVESGKANDPATLKAKIRELEGEVRKARAGAPDPAAVERAHSEGQTVAYREVAGRLRSAEDQRQAAVAALHRIEDLLSSARIGLEGAIAPLTEAPTVRMVDAASPARKAAPPQALVGPKPHPLAEENPMSGIACLTPTRFAPRPDPVSPQVSRALVSSDAVPKPEQRILDAIAWMEKIGVDNPRQVVVAFLAGFSGSKVSTYRMPRGSLATRGWVTYPSGDSNRIALTFEGRQRAQFPKSPGTLGELHRAVLDRLPNPERRILEPLIEIYPKATNQEKLATLASFASATVSTYRMPRGRLHSFELVEYPTPSEIRAAPLLFPEA